MHNCEKFEELLTLYIDHELDNTVMKQVEEHLKSCTECNNTFIMLSQIVSTCSHLEEVDPPEDFHQKLHQRLLEEKQRATGNKFVLLGNKYLRVASSIAAGLLLVVLLKDFWPNLPLPAANKTSSFSVRQEAATEIKAAKVDIEAFDNGLKMKEDKGVDSGSTLKIEDEASTVVSYNQTSDQKISNRVDNYNSYKESQSPGTDTTSREDTISRTLVPARDTEQQKKGNTIMDYKLGQTASSTSLPAVESKITTVHSVSMKMKSDKPDRTIEEIKTVYSNSGIKIEEAQQVTIQTNTTELVVENSKLVRVRAVTSQYEKIKEALITAVGAPNIQVGEIISRDISLELKEINRKLDVLNQSISEMEVRRVMNNQELEMLKIEKANTLAAIQKLIFNAQYIDITINIISD